MLLTETFMFYVGEARQTPELVTPGRRRRLKPDYRLCRVFTIQLTSSHLTPHITD